MTEAQLVERAGEGDPGAIRDLYDRYASRVYSLVRRIVGDEELAADCAQEAWVRTIRALPSYRGEARFSTWLHRIAVNTSLEALRRDEGHRLEECIPAAIPAPETPNDTLLQRRLEEALTWLPEGMRTVLVLHDVEGYTHDEIGELLGVTPGTSKSQLFKARLKMRELLSGLRTPREREGANT